MLTKILSSWSSRINAFWNNRKKSTNVFEIGYKLETKKCSPFYIQEEQFEIVDVDGFENGLKMRDGVYLPTYVRNLSMIKKLNVKKNDTIIIGFPKSG